MKYVILDWGGLEIPFIFPCFWNHKDITGAIAGRGAVVSAGFLKRDDSGNLYVTGGSTSLKVVSRPEDLDLVIKQLEFQM